MSGVGLISDLTLHITHEILVCIEDKLYHMQLSQMLNRPVGSDETKNDCQSMVVGGEYRGRISSNPFRNWGKTKLIMD